MNRQCKNQQPVPPEEPVIRHPLANQDGSVIVLVIMVLAIMTVIGIVSSDTVVTENFIIRNVGIKKQNENLVESALMQGLQEFMHLDTNNPANFDAAAVVWITNQNDVPTVANPLPDSARWYERSFTGPCLNTNNSNAASSLALLNARGEAGNGNLRYGVIGFGNVDGEIPCNGTDPCWRRGRIVAEYASVDGGGDDNGFGLMRMEIGVKRFW